VPVPGALVLLRDGARVRAEALSDARGEFRLAAPGAGTYRVGVERIGYPDHATEPFTLAAGDSLELTVELAPQAITLEGIRAEGRRRCRIDPAEGPELQRVWDEARKALFLTARTAHEGALAFEYEMYELRLDARGRDTVDEKILETRQVPDIPFASVPARDLEIFGYVRVQPGRLAFFGPDAEVLLSESFLARHCFSLRELPGRPELIGLAFEPGDMVNRPDVKGTLWLDRRTSELRWLEFGYTRLPVEELALAGGRVEFTRLPDGRWIVHSWYIRTPRAPGAVRDGELLWMGKVEGVEERGGIVTSVRPAPGA
jgi:hypothetical protein